MKTTKQCLALLSIEANYASWTRNAINIFNGSTSIFISAILLTQSTYPSDIQNTLAIGLIVVGILGLLLSGSWLLWSTLEFRQRQKAFFARTLDFTEKGYLWKYLNALIFFLLLLFLVIFLIVVLIKV